MHSISRNVINGKCFAGSNGRSEAVDCLNRGDPTISSNDISDNYEIKQILSVAVAREHFGARLDGWTDEEVAAEIARAESLVEAAAAIAVEQQQARFYRAV